MSNTSSENNQNSSSVVLLSQRNDHNLIDRASFDFRENMGENNKTSSELQVMPSPFVTEPSKVMVFYTGGTMGMKLDHNGSLLPVKGYLSERIKEMPEMKEAHMPEVTVVEYEELVDSADMGPSDWAKIATDVGEHYYQYDGFVVIMGTDTMAYAASALSFMLENLGKTVVLTGSMIPFYKGYSDARRNLLLALKLAAYSYIPEVCIYFHDQLLRGCRTMKDSTEQLGAFQSPNFVPLATAGVHVRVNHEAILRPPLLPLRIHTRMETEIMVIRLIPGYHDGPLMGLVAAPELRLKALVIAVYGTGNGPSRKSSLARFVKAATDRGVVVVAVSQCPRGSVDLQQYSVGRQLLDSGAISCGDMTTESVATKLAYLMGRGLNPEQVKAAMTVNLRGEITTHMILDASTARHKPSKL